MGSSSLSSTQRHVRSCDVHNLESHVSTVHARVASWRNALWGGKKRDLEPEGLACISASLLGSSAAYLTFLRLSFPRCSVSGRILLVANVEDSQPN